MAYKYGLLCRTHVKLSYNSHATIYKLNQTYAGLCSVIRQSQNEYFVDWLLTTGS